MNWNTYFIEFCNIVSLKSKDKSIKIGAVIIGDKNEIRSTGYNGFARGVNDNVRERYERPLKYSWTVHAEENAILNAARIGIALNGCTLYVNGLFPCSRCARGIIQSGIKQVIYKSICNPIRWKDDFKISKEMLIEAGIVLEKYTKE